MSMWHVFKRYTFREKKFIRLGLEKYGILRQLLIIALLVFCFLCFANIVCLLYFLFPLIGAALLIISFIFIGAFFLLDGSDRQGKRLQYYKKIRVISALLLLVYGSFLFLGIICTFFSGFRIQAAFSKVRFPNSYPKYVLSDKEENVYVYSSFFNRVQKFNKEKEFLKGWAIPLPAGSMRISIEDNSKIRVESVNLSNLYYYDKEGHFLGKKENLNRDSIPNNQVDFSSFNQPFIIENSLFQQNILKTDGTQTRIWLKDPFYLRLVNYPFPGIIIFVFLLFFYGYLSFLIKKAVMVTMDGR